MTEPDSDFDERMWLLEHRKLLNEHRVGQHEFFDRSLLTLASGAVGLSLPLVTYLARDGELQSVTCLGFAWTALAFSLLFNLSSYLTGARDAKDEIKAIDHEIRTGENTEFRPNLFRHITDTLNYMSLVTFIFGVVALLLFAYQNTG